MSIGKLKKFSELSTFPNVFQSPNAKKPELRNSAGAVVSLAGNWSAFFQNDHAIVAELGCGRGEYSVALAEASPDRNFIGIDIKGARIWKGAKRALEADLSNVAFVRIYVDHLETVFAENEVSEIWLTFPDPYPKKSKWKKRLTSTKFLQLYRHALRDDGILHLKTDSDLLLESILESIAEGDHTLLERIDDVWAMKDVPYVLQIKTYYEGMHLEKGETIKYLKFKLS